MYIDILQALGTRHWAMHFNTYVQSLYDMCKNSSVSGHYLICNIGYTVLYGTVHCIIVQYNKKDFSIERITFPQWAQSAST